MLDVNEEIGGILLKDFDAFILSCGLTREWHDEIYSITYIGGGYLLRVDLEHFETEEAEYYFNELLKDPDPFQLMDLLYVTIIEFDFDNKFAHSVIYPTNRKKVNEFLQKLSICLRLDEYISELYSKWAKIRLSVIDFMKSFKLEKTSDDFMLDQDDEFSITFGDAILFYMNFWDGVLRMSCYYTKVIVEVQKTLNLEELIYKELEFIEDGYKIKS